MSIPFLTLTVFLSAAIHAQDISLNEVRMLYQESAGEKKSCAKLITLLQSYNETNNPTLAGYKACATMMMARYSFNPINKLSDFIDGRSLLEKCIVTDTKNIELRLLRFTVQNEAPSFLGYKTSITEDKTFLIRSVSKIKDIQLKQFVLSFLKSSAYLSSIEKQNLPL